MNADVRSYKADQVAAKQEFTEAEILIQEIRDMLAQQDEDVLSRYTAFSASAMIDAIFGSNMIEDAGLDHEETKRLCMKIFDGEDVDPMTIEDRSPEYQASLEALRKERGIEAASDDFVIRSRREIIQHAQALKYIVNAALRRDQPLTEDLIKETHAILCKDLTRQTLVTDPVSGKQITRDVLGWEGQYRTEIASAGGTTFTPPEEIAEHMAIFIEDFNSDVKDREKGGDMDPFYLAADIAQDFVLIHPFPDGNGRMCRLLLNAYLIKYAGVVAAIGEHDQERKEYMQIAQMASEMSDVQVAELDEDGNEVMKNVLREEEAKNGLARFVLEKGTATLRKLRNALRA